MSYRLALLLPMLRNLAIDVQGRLSGCTPVELPSPTQH